MITKSTISFIVTLLIGVIILGGIAVVDSYYKTEELRKEYSMQETCTELGGSYVPEANECERISNIACESLGGTFNECASACRNNPDADICTLQCVQVCSLG